MKIVTAVQNLTAIAPLLANADHIDVKTIEGDLPLSAFIAGFLSYQPAWMTFLYRLRWAFVRLLGMKQQGVPRPTRLNPADVPWQLGEAAYFFKVVAAVPEQYWFVEAAEAHLTAKLGVVAEPLTAVRQRFHVVTVVHYNKWTGVVYFNVIRPFHHLVVGRMMKAAVTPNAF
ncbi:MAG: DUF2867 domain-containing protein [Ardenticatenaceae bacterium]|nr:DUF2867 domain-containing protein [Ardenticatenaceae bacterium]